MPQFGTVFLLQFIKKTLSDKPQEEVNFVLKRFLEDTHQIQLI